MSKKETVDISEKNGILTCRIRVPLRNHAFPYTRIYRTRNVVELLVNKGYAIDKVLEEAFVHNKADKSDMYSGTWRFKLKTKEPPKAAKKPRSTKTTKKE
tara:strand:+ start:110 stop:409 length:300 start_codon:yes stop_codon:yes gene_type:complete